VSDAFVELFGRKQEGTWSAPGRVNLIGEFTDYNDGYVLPTSLPMEAHASLARREDDVLRVASAQGTPGGGERVVEARLADLRPRGHKGWADYVLGVAWALREAGHTIGGADIRVDSEVPIGAGLSSSAALECSVALALRAAFELDLSLEQLALLAKRAENDFVGVPTGIMDQMASLLCVPGSALLLDTRSLESRQVPFALGPAGLELMVLDTRVRHELGNSAYAERRRACEVAAAEIGVPALRDVEIARMGEALARLDSKELRMRARHVITEGARVLEVVRLLEDDSVAEIGPILTAGHISLRDDFEVSSPELDVAVDSALATGALGARMVGGGFGGSAIALVRSSDSGLVERAVVEAFAAAGFAPPRVFVAAPAATKTSPD
jgi:galactokinase